ncbi:MAG: alpha/beta fold hydrolase [Bdellovibrionales bacterium]|nr:alpha/beta fold hydrolase [Bdellovibrionales bacterium]
MQLEPCVPPVWARGGHAQTILGHLLPSPQLKSKGRRIEIPLPDGDVLIGFVQPGASSTAVYIFHGLAGSTDSTYIHRTSLLAQKQGHTVFVVNHRGCGEGVGMARGPYHSGRGEDLAAVIDFGKKMYPRLRHVAVGFSLSANALLLLLSGQRGEVLPDAAIAVNAPIHLHRTSVLLRQGLNRIYDAKFYLQCRRDIIAGKADAAIKARVPRFTTLYELDDLYTAPAGGFKSREDYYTSCSTHTLLERIKVPTTIIMSKDDPFVPFESYQEAKLSPQVHLHVEEFGGHMGYLTRYKTPLGSKRWQDYAVHEALKSI